MVRGQTRCVELLLKAGANALSADGKGRTVVHRGILAQHDEATQRVLRSFPQRTRES